MAVLPSSRDPQIVAHLYSTGRLEEEMKPMTKPQFYIVAEEGERIERDKMSTVTTNVRGLEQLTCSLDVRRFIQRKPSCQWMCVMIYVDNQLLPEQCRDHKYLKEDLQRSSLEILSLPFSLRGTRGAVQITIKTHGTGKQLKWPSFSFRFLYERSPYCPFPKLIPLRHDVTKSLEFRDVHKRSKVLLNRLHELQYTVDDRKLQQLKEEKEKDEEKQKEKNEAGERSKEAERALPKIVAPQRQDGSDDEGGPSNTSRQLHLEPNASSSSSTQDQVSTCSPLWDSAWADIEGSDSAIHPGRRGQRPLQRITMTQPSSPTQHRVTPYSLLRRPCPAPDIASGKGVYHASIVRASTELDLLTLHVF